MARFGSLTAWSGEDDPDGDGVSNIDELEQGTDPNHADPITGAVEVALLEGDGDNVLLWKSVRGAGAYHVRWRSDSSGAWSEIPQAESPFLHSALANGTTYEYVVVAENALGSVTSAVVFGTPHPRAWSVAQIPPGHPFLALSAANAEHVRVFVWSETVSGPPVLRSRRFTPIGGWEPVLDVAPVAWMGVPDGTVRLIVDAEGRAVVTWMNRIAGVCQAVRLGGPTSTCEIWGSALGASSGAWSLPVRIDAGSGEWAGGSYFANHTQWNHGLAVDDQGRAMAIFSKYHGQEAVLHASAWIAHRFAESGGGGSRPRASTQARTCRAPFASPSVSMGEAVRSRSGPIPHGTLFAQRFAPATGWEIATRLNDPTRGEIGFLRDVWIDPYGNGEVRWYRNGIPVVSRVTHPRAASADGLRRNVGTGPCWELGRAGRRHRGPRLGP